MTKRDFQSYICRPYCSFFREGEKEEMACQGAVVVERLVSINKIVPSALPHFPRDQAIINLPYRHLNRHVCGMCPFRIHDCDFQAEIPPDKAEPCGGYILLAILKHNGLLSSTDIMGACLA